MNKHKILALAAFGFLLLCAYGLGLNLVQHSYGLAVVMIICIFVNIWTITTQMKMSNRMEQQIHFR
jgi:hypothetical protein